MTLMTHEDLSSRAELRETSCIFHESSALKLHIRYSAHLGLLKCSIYPQFHRYWSWEYLFWWDKWLIEEAGAYIEIFFLLNIVRSKYSCLNMLLDQHNYILLSSAQVLFDVDIFIKHFIYTYIVMIFIYIFIYIYIYGDDVYIYIYV